MEAFQRMTSAKRARRRSKRQSTAAAMQRQQQVVIRLDAADARLHCCRARRMHERIREGSKVETGNFLSSLARSLHTRRRHPASDSLYMRTHCWCTLNNFIIYPCKSSRTHFYYIVSLSPPRVPLSVCVREERRFFIHIDRKLLRFRFHPRIITKHCVVAW